MKRTLKLILGLTLLAAATAHAQYSSDWSQFDSGAATHNGGTFTHAGVIGGWLPQPAQSASYENQSGNPQVPTPAQSVIPPILNISWSGFNLRVAWSDSAVGFLLQGKPAFEPANPWTDIPGPYQQGGGEFFILVSPVEESRFYRLISP